MDEIKQYGTPRPRPKGRFVLCGYGYVEHGLLTHALTVQRCSCRLFISLNAQQHGFKVAGRYIIQTFAQEKSKLQRPIFSNEPPFMKLGPETILKFIYPFYGLVESGVHWLFRYHVHHRKRLGLQAVVYDYCYLYSPSYYGNITSVGHSSKIPSQCNGSSVTFNEENIANACDEQPKVWFLCR